MIRNKAFKFRITEEERMMIAAIAEWLQRNQSDAIRWLLRAVAEEMGVGPYNPQTRETQQFNDNQSEDTGKRTTYAP